MKKGISLIVLVVTIIITIMLAGVGIIEYNDIVIKTKLFSFASEIYMVENAVSEYEFRNNLLPLSSAITFDVNSVPESSKNQFADIMSEGSTISLYTIDYSKADIKELTRGTKKNNDTDDIYVYSTLSKKVYYLKGIVANNIKYYTLTNELYDLIGINKVK